MSYDAKCHDLAAAFLADERLTPEARERHTDRLAEEIQNAIESFLSHDDALSLDRADLTRRQARDERTRAGGG